MNIKIFLGGALAAFPLFIIYIQVLRLRVIARTEELLETRRKVATTSFQFQAIFDNAAVGIIAVGWDMNCALTNHAIQNMLHYTGEELKQKTILEITHPDDVRESEIKVGGATGSGPVRLVKRYLRKDGSILRAKLTARRFEKSESEFNAIAVIEDITTQTEAEETIRDQQKQLQDSAVKNARIAGMSEIATGVLHNVGNVLNSANVGLETIIQKLDRSVIGNLYKANDLLKQNRYRLGEFFSKDPKGEKLIDFYFDIENAIKGEALEQKDEAAELMKKFQLIKDIISTQQMYAKGSGEFKENLSLIDIIENGLSLQGSALTRHEIKVVRKFSEVPPVLAQKAKLVHVVLNLIKNAKEAMDTRDGREKVLTLEIGGNENGNIFFKVSDTGIGIDKENTSKIFSHGFTTKKTGHGFGLHFCANSATEMGAKISVSSDGIGHGATFTFEFTQKIDMAQSA